jgi:hypothetical protein
MRTPIVISDGGRKFQYMVSSSEESEIMVGNEFSILDNSTVEPGTTIELNTYIASKTQEPLVRFNNYWKRVNFSGVVDGCLPENIHKHTIQIDIPDYSPSTYSNVEYMVDISTHIGLTKVVLACEKFTFDDLLSLPKPYRDGQHKYHQYYSVDILDPWDLCYSDDFAEFRTEFCLEVPDTNNCGALVDIEISAVTEEGNDIIPDTRYRSGRNLILLSERDSDYMTMDLKSVPDGWQASLVFNKAFDGDLKTYLSETYFIDVESCIPEIVIMDKDNGYKLLDLDPIDLTGGAVLGDILFSSSNESLRFDDWSDYFDGMFAISTLRLVDSEGNEVMYLKSNIVPIDKQKFSYIVGKEITLEDMDITVENLDVVNKIQKNIVKVNRPDDYKSNIIKPVFYRSFPLEEIEIHDSVTFTISVDLDSYKTKSNSFSIQIEGKNFTEIGRVPGGVLFKITGSELPHANPNGKYYILDEYKELVAEGNYRYV